ncbi:MAG: hypothetical protein AUH13_31405 [Acidobacteria bacterium 13_2_20CM_58_27]|nr:MAG: hypothetical protein AUH13_31405 [Acidobacteria bacterium 13_2_20CM_58_27]
MFPHLDTVIAFVVLMLVASLFITAVTQVVVSLLGLRGVNLQRGLVDLFETAYPDQEARRWAKEIARRVLRHPTISDSIFSRFSLRVDQVPFIPPETAGKLQGISASIPLLPLIMGAVGGLVITPIAMAIAKHWFADTWLYTDHLAGYVSVINFCQHPLGTGALVGAILGGLLSRWRLATSIRVEELPAILEKLAEPLPGTLPDPAQRAMLMMAWSENKSGARSRPGAPQEGVPVRLKPYCDEGIVRRASEASSPQNERLSPAEDFDEGIVRHAEPVETEARHAVAMENATAPAKERLSPAEDFDEGIVRHAEPVETEARLAVAMENATAPAKELEPESTPATGALASVSTPSEPRLEGLRAWFDHVMDRASQRFAFEARLVTIVLSCIFVFAAHFDSARLFRSMSEEAELRARLAASAEALDKHAEQLSRPKENAHTVVPDVYRKAMVSILRTAPAIPEPAKRKARSKKREKVAATAAPAEDRVTSEAKSKAMHALETSPGFASREEAESWLRATLDGNSARETLAAEYQQEVNAELVSDSDKLIDQSASLKSELARSEFKLFQDERLSPLSSTAGPGLLFTIAFLSLGAAFWYNTLKNLASLRPQLAARQDRERKHEKPA